MIKAPLFCKMKKALFILPFIFLFGCVISPSLPPKVIAGKTISYYVTQVGGKFDNSIYNKHLVFHFDHSGTYRTDLDGSFFQAGDYSYLVLSKSRAKIMITYSSDSNDYQYQYQMNFNTPTSGSWTATFSNNPGIDQGEKGTFEILD